MFTGLVETLGTLVAVTGTSPKRLTIASSLPMADIAIGDSIAIDGCCLTVVEKSSAGLSFEAATETLLRTTLGELKVGDTVNLERALLATARLGGHIVTGHVDCVAKVTHVDLRGSALYVGIELPADLARLVAARGSITVAGVSLTVTDVQNNTFFVGLIPHTLQVTTLGRVAIGGRMNIEVDLLARYVERLLATRPLTP